MDTGRKRWEDCWSQGNHVQALCIGVSEYTELNTLPNAVLDAKRIAHCVDELGRNKSQIVANPMSKSELKREVQDFVRRIDRDRPPRIVLVFYAGHGMQEGDAIYLLPAKVNPKTPEELKLQGLSHDELFKSLKRVDDAIKRQTGVENVLYLVILDTCRESLEWSQVVAGYSPEIQEPLSENRPEHWLLFTSTSRRATAYDGDDGRNSPFTQALMSVECGLFNPFVPLNQALKLVCKKLGEQKPCLMPAQNIPNKLCLHPSRKQDQTEERFDICVCYREGGADSALAERLRDKLEGCNVRFGEFDKRRLRVFLKGGAAPPSANVQVASALFGSTVILLLVSRDTFADVDKLREDSQAKDWLVQLLWKYQMTLELFNAGQHKVVPLLIGRKHEKNGRNEFELFDKSDQHEKFWHLRKIASDLKENSVVKNALDGLRCSETFAKGLDDEMLTQRPGILLIIRGRSVKQSVMAFSSTDTFMPWKLKGVRDNAITKLCRELTLLLESAYEKRDTSSLENTMSGARRVLEAGC